ncbi:MAG: hypothetical protein KC964_05165, partial [Candidatus Omnitrophica bacterium]|nr:hypothetical protein [Candidatus Omnitrophota bacterium]
MTHPLHRSTRTFGRISFLIAALLASFSLAAESSGNSDNPKGVIPTTNLTLDMNPESEVITVSNAGSGRITVNSSISGSQTFDAPLITLTLNALGGNDTINLISLPAGMAPTFLVVNGGDGNDELTTDFTGGDPVPLGGLTFNGDGQTGSPGDSLVVKGVFTNQLLDYTNAHDGSIFVDSNPINYTGLEPITGGNSSHTTLNLPDGVRNEASLRNHATTGFIEIFPDSGTFETTALP